MKFERQVINFYKLSPSGSINLRPLNYCHLQQYNLNVMTKKTSFNNLQKIFDNVARLFSRSQTATIFRQVS